MSQCAYCDKKPSTGRFYVRRGVAKAKGGVGLKITGKTKRWFKINLQKKKIIEPNGHVHSVYVCTKCLRSGKITKAPNQKMLAEKSAQNSVA